MTTLRGLPYDVVVVVLRFLARGREALALRATCTFEAQRVEELHALWREERGRLHLPGRTDLLWLLGTYRNANRERLEQRRAFYEFVVSARLRLGRWRGQNDLPLPRKRRFSVDVYARIRRGGSSEVHCDNPKPVFFHDDTHVVSMGETQDSVPFTLKGVFGPGASQSSVFERLMGRHIFDALCGLSSTVFFYGQTGSGKTFTCLGRDETCLDGIVPVTLAYLLANANQQQQHQHPHERVSLSFRVLEVYCERVFDLVADTRILHARHAEELLQQVWGKRSTRATQWNHRSSRSHAIFSLRVTVTRGTQRLESTLNLVDLAGAERQRENSVPGAGPPTPSDEDNAELVREASRINMSLTTLGRVLQALADGDAHVPYRDSKLTSLLRASLGGSVQMQRENRTLAASGRTAFFLTLSDAKDHWRESLATLRFGERASRVNLETTAEDGPLGTSSLGSIQRQLQVVEGEMRNLKYIWQTTGEGRHDRLCRCDRCEDRDRERDPEPLHIPRYQSLLARRGELEQAAEDARMALLGAFLV